jgi:NAD(P)H-hydrate epimerase
VVHAALGDPAGQRILVLCGGNNGGDGWCGPPCARPARRSWRCWRLDEASEEAQINGTLWEDEGGELHELITEADVERFFARGVDADLVVDALLGTGTSGEPRGLLVPAIRALNGLERPVVAVDIPSGIDADTGAVPGLSVVADHTVTLGLPKRGHYLYPARERVGQLDVVDIGLPNEAVLAVDPRSS